MRWPAAQAFIVGANLPWLSYGGDFGANRWQPSGGIGRPGRREAVREVLTRLADAGVTAVRWFMLADGRAGISESPGGDLAGLDEFVLRDADAALEAIEHAGLQGIFVLFDFHWFRRARVVDGVQTGGRGRLAADPALRAGLLDRVIRPLLGHCGQHASIAAWDVINEPEWATRGTTAPLRTFQVSRQAMRAFVGDTVEAIHEMTRHAATVGCVSTESLSLVEGLGLDVYQAHWYDHLAAQAPLDRPAAEFRLDRPLVLGEFPTRGSARTAADILETARRAGYAGAFAWSVLSADAASDHDAFVTGLGEFLAS